jgi:PRC-barrel domain protein
MHGRFRTISAVTLIALCATGGPSAQEAGVQQTPVRTDQSAAAPARTPEPPTEPPSVTVLGSWQAQGVLGRDVRSTADENMGRIVDVIVDRTGRVRAAIIDFGGFLGVGSRKIAVDWNAFRFRPDSAKRDVITLGLTRDQVKEAPEYKDKQPVVVLGAAGGLQSLPTD